MACGTGKPNLLLHQFTDIIDKSVLVLLHVNNIKLTMDRIHKFVYSDLKCDIYFNNQKINK